MSLDTFLTLLITVIFISILPVIKKIINDKKDAKTKNKINYAIVIFHITVIIILCFVYFFSNEDKKKETWKNQMEQANIDYNERDFISSAKKYRNASLIAYDDESLVQSYYFEGSSYFLYALMNSDQRYYNMALNIFDNIIQNQEYKKIEWYQDAIIDTCLIYHYNQYNCDKEKWKKYIEYLDLKYNKYNNLDNLSSQEVDILMKASLAIGFYYDDKIDESMETFSNKYFYDKALKYYNIYIDLMEINNLNKGELNILVNTMPINLKISDFMLNYILTDNDISNGITLIEKSINFSYSQINKLKNDKNYLEFYILFKKNIGKGYFLLGSYSLDKKDYYLNKAYTELQDVIYLEDENLQDYLIDACYYSILSGKCSEKDINRIYDFFTKIIDKNSNADNYDMKITAEITACTAYLYLINNYKNVDNIINKKLDLYLNELTTTLYDLTSNIEKEKIDNIKRGVIETNEH